MMRAPIRPRLLPATIAMTALLLAWKCVSVGILLIAGPGGAAFDRAPFIVAAAEAAPAEPASHAGAKTPPAPSAPATSAAAPAPAIPAPAAASAMAGPMVIVPQPRPEPEVSPAERQLLADLRARRMELDVREHALAEKTAAIETAAHTLDDRIGQLAGLQARLERLEAERKAHDEANWTGIVKMYEAMKPRDAAVIFNDMEMGVLLQVVDRMKDAKAAAIMAAMQPDRARMLTSQLAVVRTKAITVPDHAGAS